MLQGLDIRDILLIDRLELSFQPGLNALTGETGAGKSILLDSLGFVLGWRGRADLVREGADQGEVTATFHLEPDHPAHGVLAEAGLPEGEDGELILRRLNARDGRKTAWVNDRRVSGEVLRKLADVLVELHGQHDDRGLLNPSGHRALLDAFGGHEGKLSAVRAAYRAVAEARKAEDEVRTALEAARAEEDFLRHAVAELDALEPQPGEDATLDARRRLMQAAERIRDDVARAAEAMGGQGAEGLLVDAGRWLGGVADKAEGGLDGVIAALDRTLIELAEAQGAILESLDAMSVNPGELEETEARLFAIRGLARKHNVAPDDLAALASDLRTRLEALDAGESGLAAAAAATQAAQAAFDKAAGALSTARKAAAKALDRDMAGELAPLKLERAVFSTRIASAEPGPSGQDEVAFEVATNPGAPSGPLNKIASGGELSRFLLALKVCLTRGASGLTLIFDEIDRGVGGATADAVGRRLRDLADRGQVLVVTHSPQVAARAGHHWRVEKRQGKSTTLSSVTALDQGARVDEIARMLSGDTVTDAARDAARALIG